MLKLRYQIKQSQISLRHVHIADYKAGRNTHLVDPHTFSSAKRSGVAVRRPFGTCFPIPGRPTCHLGRDRDRQAFVAG